MHQLSQHSSANTTTPDGHVAFAELSPDQWDDVLATLNCKQLHEIRSVVTSRIAELRAAAIAQLRSAIAEQAKLLNVEMKDLVPKETRKTRATERVKLGG